MSEGVKKKSTRKRVEVAKPKRKKSGGRKAGTPNKDNPKLSLLEYARKDGGKSPVEFLLDIMNGNADTAEHKFTQNERVDAAKAAAPYCHPKLRSTEIKGEIIPATLIIKNA